MTTVPDITLRDGHTIPQLGIGVWQVSDDDVATSLAKAFEVGYRHVDTAAIYKNEEAVGRAIKDSGLARDEIFVTTKLWNDRHPNAVEACEESLEKLGLERVDLYLVHWPAPRYGLFREAWEGMIKVREAGLATSIGVSNFTVENLTAIIDSTGEVPVVNQIELHPTLAQRELKTFHADHDIVTEAWSPLGQSKELEREEIIAIADRLGITPAQVIIRWHLDHGHVVFPKSVTPSRIEENFAALDVTLDDEARTVLDGLDHGNRIGADPNNTEF